jgi:hypothetical protein
MTIGSRIISELGRRQRLGMYFDYAEYSALHRVDSIADLAEFFHNKGLQDPPITADPRQVVDWLESVAPSLSFESDAMMLAIPSYGLFALLAIWLLRQRRVSVLVLLALLVIATLYMAILFAFTG